MGEATLTTGRHTDARLGELRPGDVWQAAEWFVSPEVECRRQGLKALCTTPETRFSPLVVHLLASRLDEPDVGLRRSIIGALARCLETPTPQATRDHLAALLSGLTRTQVEWLLEAAGPPGATAHTLQVRRPVVALLDRIPDLAGLLTRIAADRSAAIPIRSAAIAALAELGVIEARPALEGLKTRIEGRTAGQMAMAFAPRSGQDEDNLLDVLKTAIDMLLASE